MHPWSRYQWCIHNYSLCHDKSCTVVNAGDILKELVNIVHTQFKKSLGGDVSRLLVAVDDSKNSWEYKNSDRKTRKKAVNNDFGINRL